MEALMILGGVMVAVTGIPLPLIYLDYRKDGLSNQQFVADAKYQLLEKRPGVVAAFFAGLALLTWGVFA